MNFVHRPEQQQQGVKQNTDTYTHTHARTVAHCRDRRVRFLRREATTYLRLKHPGTSKFSTECFFFISLSLSVLCFGLSLRTPENGIRVTSNGSSVPLVQCKAQKTEIATCRAIDKLLGTLFPTYNSWKVRAFTFGVSHITSGNAHVSLE